MLTFIKKIFHENIRVVKVNDDQYIKERPMTNLHFKTFEIRFNFPQILELRITFASCRSFMTYKYYNKIPMSAVERKLNMNIDKIPYLINSLNRSIHHPMIRKFSHI